MVCEHNNERIREARLIVARPEQVLTELEKYSADLKSNILSVVDEHLERSLLARSDPLIDIGLACYAGKNEVVAALYQKSLAKPADHLQERYLRGLRFACLSNEVVGIRHFLGAGFPENVLGTEEFARLVDEGEEDELATLLTNPNIAEEVLEALYKNEGLFASLSDERRRRLVLLSTMNPRLTTNEDSEYGPDLGYMGIHKGIITMLSSAPTNEHWLITLRQFLAPLDPGDLYSPDEAITPILERWAQVTVPLKYFKDGFYTPLSMKDEFRCLVAAMYGSHYSRDKDNKFTSIILGTPDSPDVVLRCAYYGKAQLTKQEMEDGFERDAVVYELAVLCNDSVYYKPALRKLLEEEQLHGDLRYFYQRRCAQIHKRRPSFDPRPVSDWLLEDAVPESKELTILKKLEKTLASMTKTFKTVQTSIIWGFFVLWALVLYLVLYQGTKI